MIKKTFLILCLIFLPTLLLAEQVLDKIAAVVGNQIILQSDLEAQLQMIAASRNLDLKNPETKMKMARELLQQMINDRLILVQAEKDTTLKVTSKEVESSLEEEIARIKGQFPSEEIYQEQLKKEGLTETELKRRYREQIRSQLLKDKLISQRLSKVSVSSKEVKDFFALYQDSLPEQPEQVKLSHILLAVKPGLTTSDSLKKLAERVDSLAQKGEDFAGLAEKYSDDLTAKSGGDLGFFKKGEMVSEFEKAAFALKIGEVSPVVESEFGFHIIKLEEIMGEQIRVRHILFRIQPFLADTQATFTLAESLIQKIKKGEAFDSLAKEYSVDEESKKMGGELDWYAVEQMDPEFKSAVQNLGVNEISPPVKTRFGIHIFKVLDKKEKRKFELEKDWDVIKDLIRKKKVNEQVAAWVKDLREKTYVEERL
jgi:peptidyl-prolyl cis-trans isomerase SurA